MKPPTRTQIRPGTSGSYRQGGGTVTGENGTPCRWPAHTDREGWDSWRHDVPLAELLQGAFHLRTQIYFSPRTCGPELEMSNRLGLVLEEIKERAVLAEKVVHGLQTVWDDLRNCAHAWDPECARCRWLRPLADALQDFERHNDPEDEANEGSRSDREAGRHRSR